MKKNLWSVGEINGAMEELVARRSGGKEEARE